MAPAIEKVPGDAGNTRDARDARDSNTKDDGNDSKDQAFAIPPTEATVVFVLGGPGAGKGTVCARLVQSYGFTHLSAGDLLRAEQDRPGSEYGDLIRSYIREGTIVPTEITVKLLEKAMRATLQGKAQPGDQSTAAAAAAGEASATSRSRVAGDGAAKTVFLIDGFPRKLDQADHFEATVCPAQLVLFFDCPEDVLERRLLKRGETSGRDDDNAESIRKRFRTFVDATMPVVDRFKAQGRLAAVSAAGSRDEVFDATVETVKSRLLKQAGSHSS